MLKSWKDIAKFLEVTVRTLQRWQKVKLIPVYKIGNKVFIDEKDLEEWIRDFNGLERKHPTPQDVTHLK
jgi:excisionase family DNA binding protein